MNETNDVIPQEEQTPDGFAKALAEAHRHAPRMRTELNKALGSLDALDQIVEMASAPTLFGEDYLDYTRAAHGALWDAIEAGYQALSQGGEANKHIFAILRVFMGRRWRKLREDRNNETDE